MLLSSAYLTKRCPPRSSSRSSSSSTRLLNRVESGPPCGVPSTLGLTNPFSITPAFPFCAVRWPPVNDQEDLPLGCHEKTLDKLYKGIGVHAAVFYDHEPQVS